MKTLEAAGSTKDANFGKTVALFRCRSCLERVRIKCLRSVGAWVYRVEKLLNTLAEMGAACLMRGNLQKR